MAELKPCPFCGGNPETSVCCTDWKDAMQSFLVEVKCMDCKVSRYVFVTGDRLTFFDFDVAFEKAEDAWNRRADCEHID